MLVVQGSSTTAVVRGTTGEPVILLSEELHECSTASALADVMNMALAVLDREEMAALRGCLTALRCGEQLSRRRMEINGSVLTIYRR
ncbi:hypothetical protein [Streptomyces sp. H51]|uniref:hypothetical protein n=1 Tax=Streptomyces sp. H51 TaxID=3111770 RepID=UPI002D77D40C|nr:hypothetical protein [Streptomyces sp. H51]